MCIKHDGSAAECSWHKSFILHSRNKQNQQGENLSFFFFWVVFFQFGLWSMHCVSVWSSCLWCGAEQMCAFYKWRMLACVINNHVFRCYCSLEALTDNSPSQTGVFQKILFTSFVMVNCCEIQNMQRVKASLMCWLPTVKTVICFVHVFQIIIYEQLLFSLKFLVKKKKKVFIAYYLELENSL